MNNALITDEQRIVLLANGRESLQNPNFDPAPVVKLFTPDGGATWLLTEIDPDDHDHAFGLCDLGLGEPEIGWVSLAELAAVRGGLGLPVERDLHFRAEKRLSGYARDARLAGRIVVGPALGAPQGSPSLRALGARCLRTCGAARFACLQGKALRAIPAAQAWRP